MGVSARRPEGAEEGLVLDAGRRQAERSVGHADDVEVDAVVVVLAARRLVAVLAHAQADDAALRPLQRPRRRAR